MNSSISTELFKSGITLFSPLSQGNLGLENEGRRHGTLPKVLRERQ